MLTKMSVMLGTGMNWFTLTTFYHMFERERGIATIFDKLKLSHTDNMKNVWMHQIFMHFMEEILWKKKNEK